MRFTFTPLTAEQAMIISEWRYDPPYGFYNASEDPDDQQELLDRSSPFYAVKDEQDDLIGFFCFKVTAQVPAGYASGAYDDPHALDIGLGLRPDLTGKGLGPAFFNAGLEFARKRYAPPTFRLAVATFNRRAILVYERAGFRRTHTFLHQTNGGEYEFICMVKEE